MQGGGRPNETRFLEERSMQRVALWMALSATLWCCRREPPAEPDIVGSSPIDLSELVERTRVRFRSDGDGFGGSGRAWGVRVQGDAITIATSPRSMVTFRSVAVSRARASLDLDGALHVPRDAGVVETIRNRENGVEQSWRFPVKPDAPVRLSIEVSGQVYAGASEHGLHFVDPSTGLGTRYGVAWWIDASGVKTRIDPIWNHDRIEIAIPDELLAKSTYPAVLDPVISPESGIDQPLRRSTQGLEGGGRVTSGAGVHLIVWSEEAINSIIPGQIHAVRIRASDGALLDQRPIAVGAGWDPAAVFDGSSNFFVAYSAQVTRSNGSRALQIGGKRIRASDGAVLDANSLPISEEDRFGRLSVSFGSARFLVAWTQEGALGASDVYARLLDGNGVRIGTDDVLIAGTTAVERDAFACFANGHFLVGYRTEVSLNVYSIGARRIRASDGALLDAGGLSVAAAPPNRSSPTCSGSTTHHLIAWTESSSGISMRRLEPATGSLDPSSTQLAASGGVPRLTFDGTNFFAIWNDALSPPGTGDVYGRRFAPDLTLLDGPLASRGIAIATATISEYPESVAEVDGTYYALWSIYQSRYDLVGRRVRASDGAVLDSAPRRITFNANPQVQPSVAYGGGNFLVAWYDRRYSFDRFYDLDLVGVRVRASDGLVLDPSGMTILENLATVYAPAGMASDGTNFLVVAHRRPIMSLDTEIVARRVRSSDGAILDASDIVIDPLSVIEDMHAKTAVAFGGNAYVVVFPRFVNDPQQGRISRQIISRRIEPSAGTLLGSEVVVANDPTRALSTPAIACESQTCMTAWLAGTDLSHLEDLHAARVHAFNGTLVDTTPFVLVPPTASNRQFFSADLAFDGTDYFVVWQRTGDLYGRRVRSNGSILGAPEVLISPGLNYSLSPRIAFDGLHFIVAWPGNFNDPTWYFSTARVLPPATLVDTTRLNLGPSTSDRPSIAIASNGAGQSLAVYSRFDERPGIFSERVFARMITNLPDGSNGLPCTMSDECASGQCIDAVCCDTSCGNGDPNDCLACSFAAGAPQDGTCSFRPATALCRPVAKSCDPVEYCTGTSGDCPPDIISGGCPDAGEPDATEAETPPKPTQKPTQRPSTPWRSMRWKNSSTRPSTPTQRSSRMQPRRSTRWRMPVSSMNHPRTTADASASSLRDRRPEKCGGSSSCWSESGCGSAFYSS
jgi:large repetitive protein